MGCCGDQPDIPDPNESYVAGVLADLETLPARRRIEAAAALGIPVEVLLGNQRVGADFTGLGQAEVQREFARQMAGQLLELQRTLGPEQVQQRLDELQRSDPEGFAMRRELWDAIRTDVDQARTQERPGAQALEDMILGELERGAELPESVERRLSQGVLGGQVGRGNYLGNAAAQEEADTLVGAGEQWRGQREQDALRFLTSGVSPADVGQRREQQGLANLGAFISGETPIAQFGQVSGAQQGAVPWNTQGVQLPGVNPNAGAQGVNFAQQLYGGQVDWRNAQVNPWVAGLAGGAQGLNAWASLGGGQHRPVNWQIPNVANSPGNAGVDWNAGAGGWGGQA